jgi:phosphate starvation-inducible protein PhoH and related proteins
MPRGSRRTKKSRKSRKRPSPYEVTTREIGPPKLDAALLHPLEPKTVGQEVFLTAIREKPVVICEGPAGTGKTFISFGSALRSYLKDSNILRIVIVRPTIPAGDEPGLGFLPGNIDDKMAPFMAPILRDSAPLLIKKHARNAGDSRFIERFGNSNSDYIASMLSRFDIEIVPLHLMRGRSFHNSFVILDEAQNCTMGDFKMFLTRVGRKSTVIIEGDATQKDRAGGSLPELMQRLDGLPMVECVKLTSEDIIRNPMISDIIDRLK